MNTLTKAKIADIYEFEPPRNARCPNPSLSMRRKIVSFFFDQITEKAEEQPIIVKHLGRFERVLKTARPGRNPKKKTQDHLIEARSILKMSPSISLRKALKYDDD